MSTLSFDDIPTTTTTMVVVTNCIVQNKTFFQLIECAPFTPRTFKRGRQKTGDTLDPILLQEGDIIFAQMDSFNKGVYPTKKKSDTPFPNSITLVMFYRKRFVNIKVTSNGKYQMVGCTSVEMAADCIRLLWSKIRALKCYEFSKSSFFGTFTPNALVMIFIVAMKKIVFHTNVAIDKDQANVILNKSDNYRSILRKTGNYVGMNIKETIPCSHFPHFHVPFICMNMDTLEMDKVKWMDYHDYFQTLPIVDQKRLTTKSKNRRTTFLLFQSGKCIMISPCPDEMKIPYSRFNQFLRDNLIEMNSESPKQ